MKFYSRALPWKPFQRISSKIRQGLVTLYFSWVAQKYSIVEAFLCILEEPRRAAAGVVGEEHRKWEESPANNKSEHPFPEHFDMHLW
jgi:hypothetical protein